MEEIPIHWWPGISRVKNGNKLRFVEKRNTSGYKGKGNHLLYFNESRNIIIVDKNRVVRAFYKSKIPETDFPKLIKPISELQNQ